MRAKKHLGQHFLRSASALKKIVGAAELREEETVLEIGPGEGVLTEKLLAHAREVVAIEKDAELVNTLKIRFVSEITAGRLKIITGDILTTKLESVGLTSGSFVVVANIPYYITGEILRKILSEGIQPKRAVLLVQKEVAERIGRSKKESLLSLSVKAYGTPEYIATVPRGAFSPSPSVDSAILRINAISQEFFTDLTPDTFFKILKLGFGKKRKQLLGNLSSAYPKESLSDIFEELEMPLKVRAEDISLPIWQKLCLKLN